jgi:hypothetical protein
VPLLMASGPTVRKTSRSGVQVLWHLGGATHFLRFIHVHVINNLLLYLKEPSTDSKGLCKTVYCSFTPPALWQRIAAHE